MTLFYTLEINEHQINSTKMKSGNSKNFQKQKNSGLKNLAKTKNVTDTASILDKTFNLKPISRNDKVKKIKIKVKVPSTAIHWI